MSLCPKFKWFNQSIVRFHKENPQINKIATADN